MKNVAGYDLPKLFIGSYGTLGVIVEATVKLRPLPEQEELVSVRFDRLKDAGSAVKAVAASDLIPNAVELLDGAGASGAGLAASSPAPGGVLVVGFDGSASRSTGSAPSSRASRGRWRARPEAPRRGRVDPAADGRARGILDDRGRDDPRGVAESGRGDHGAGRRHRPRARGFRARGQPTRGSASCAARSRQSRRRRTLRRSPSSSPSGARWLAPAAGTRISNGRRSRSNRRSRCGTIPGAAGRIMERIKAQLDPRNILNPGRFVAGI